MAVADCQRALGSIRSRASGPSFAGHRLQAIALDFGGENAPLELEDPKAPAVAKSSGHRGHRLGRADLAPGVERMVTPAARFDQMGIFRITG